MLNESVTLSVFLSYPLEDYLIIHLGAFQLFAPSGDDLTRWRVSLSEARLSIKDKLQWVNQGPIIYYRKNRSERTYLHESGNYSKVKSS